MFCSIQQSSNHAQEFIRTVFPIVGVYILSETNIKRETNFGYNDAVRFRISTSCEGSSPIWKTTNISQDVVEEVWCLEVEDDHSFVMPNGIVTGNCTASYVDRPKFFQECMYLLLCGCGVGFSVQPHHVEKLPKIDVRNKGKKDFVIPDTIEGWADAIGVLMTSYFVNSGTYFSYDYEMNFESFSGYEIEFDYSQIRPKGAAISWGGKAPGPAGLKNAINKITKLLDSIVETNGKVKLKPIEAYDILMHSSDAVLSGGIRRSATICLFDPEDEEMLKAKTGDWFIENPQRGRSNNSALLVRDETTKELFSSLMSSVKEFGEPGFVFAENKELLVNPCCEVGMYAYDDDGKSGFQFCNLCEINGKKAVSEEAFLEQCRAGAILGTIQAMYDSFDYLEESTEKIVKRDALLGVSMTGMMDNPEITFNPEIQKKGAKLILKVNSDIAKKIGINEAKRCSVVKPAGSTSCMLGTASGIHPQHSNRYIRRVQANKLEFPAQHFAKINPDAVEESVWSNNNTDNVISFLCEVPNGAKTKNQIGALELLEHVKLTQQNWIEYGTRERTTGDQSWLRHNVSNTINVKPDEWEDVENFIYKNRKWYAGISLLPHSGDLDYPQAPFSSILNERELVKEYGEGTVFASGLVVDGLYAFDNNLWKACDAVFGVGFDLDSRYKDTLEPVIPEKNGYTQKQWNEKLVEFTVSHKEWLEQKELKDKNDAQHEWIRRFKKFASRYCECDLRKCSHMVKHVSLWKKWLDLKRTYKEIDWRDVQEDEYEIDVSKIGGAACAGGKCDTSLEI